MNPGDADAMIVVGGSGSGERDESVRALARAGRVEAHGIGLCPGETTAFGFVGTAPVLIVPGRLDAALAVWHVIGARLLARLAGRSDAPVGAQCKACPQDRLDGRARRVRAGAQPMVTPSFRWPRAICRGGCWRRRRAMFWFRRKARVLRRVPSCRSSRYEHCRRHTHAIAADLLAAVRRAARQEQFLEVVSPEEARARFAAHVDFSPRGHETAALAAALGRVLAADVAAPIDVPPFDRSGVDGFAVRAADTADATEMTPRRLALNPEVIACGTAPQVEVRPGTATTIATGGMIPRGADAVVMIEHTELAGNRARAGDRRAPRGCGPGNSSASPAPTSRAAKRVLRKGTRLTSREIGMLAACGLASVDVMRRPKVAVLGTGDELVQPGEPATPRRGL